MHFPVVFHIGPVAISLHMVCELLAFFAGFRYFLFLRKKQGDLFSSSRRTSVIIGAVFGALIGSRLIGALERPDQLFTTENIFIYIYNNKTVVGGFLGGLVGVELMKERIGEIKASGDLFVYPIILALIIGRVGCFSMGVFEETYGIASTLIWSIDLGDGINRHPVALYEIIFLVILWTGLAATKRNMQLNNGALFKLFMIFYLAFRLLLELIKPHYTVAIGLSTIQLSCVAGLIYYLPYIMQPKKLVTAYA